MAKPKPPEPPKRNENEDDERRTRERNRPQLPRKTVKPGDKGEDVERLQGWLKRKKYLNDDEKEGDKAVYGPKTRDAVLRFQKDLELQKDGIAGNQTLGRIAGVKRQPSLTYVPPSEKERKDGKVKPEETEHEVARLQAKREKKIERDFGPDASDHAERSKKGKFDKLTGREEEDRADEAAQAVVRTYERTKEKPDSAVNASREISEFVQKYKDESPQMVERYLGQVKDVVADIGRRAMSPDGDYDGQLSKEKTTEVVKALAGAANAAGTKGARSIAASFTDSVRDTSEKAHEIDKDKTFRKSLHDVVKNHDGGLFVTAVAEQFAKKGTAGKGDNGIKEVGGQIAQAARNGMQEKFNDFQNKQRELETKLSSLIPPGTSPEEKSRKLEEFMQGPQNRSLMNEVNELGVQVAKDYPAIALAKSFPQKYQDGDDEFDNLNEFGKKQFEKKNLDALVTAPEAMYQLRKILSAEIRDGGRNDDKQVAPSPLMLALKERFPAKGADADNAADVLQKMRRSMLAATAKAWQVDAIEKASPGMDAFLKGHSPDGIAGKENDKDEGRLLAAYRKTTDGKKMLETLKEAGVDFRNVRFVKSGGSYYDDSTGTVVIDQSRSEGGQLSDLAHALSYAHAKKTSELPDPTSPRVGVGNYVDAAIREEAEALAHSFEARRHGRKPPKQMNAVEQAYFEAYSKALKRGKDHWEAVDAGTATLERKLRAGRTLRASDEETWAQRAKEEYYSQKTAAKARGDAANKTGKVTPSTGPMIEGP